MRANAFMQIRARCVKQRLCNYNRTSQSEKPFNETQSNKSAVRIIKTSNARRRTRKANQQVHTHEYTLTQVYNTRASLKIDV